MTCACNGTGLISRTYASHTRTVPCPCRERGETVAGLRAEVERLRRLNVGLIVRLAACCEVLAKKANRLPDECPRCGQSMAFGVDASDVPG